jgi:hypothetical protein
MKTGAAIGMQTLMRTRRDAKLMKLRNRHTCAVAVFEFLPACRPEDSHAMWQRVVGVLLLMPVAGCVRVSGSVCCL